MIIRVPEDPRYGITAKVGSFTTEYGVTGEELRRKIQQMAEKFVSDMEKRGLRLVTGVPGNPTVVCHEDGSPMATYALDWDAVPSSDEEARRVPQSLEESRGLVDYRIVGVFWTPMAAVERVTTLEAIREEERARRNPVSFRVVRKEAPDGSGTGS